MSEDEHAKEQAERLAEAERQAIAQAKQGFFSNLVGTISISVIDPGGDPVYDIEGNIVGRSEPLHELVYNNARR